MSPDQLDRLIGRSCAIAIVVLVALLAAGAL